MSFYPSSDPESRPIVQELRRHLGDALLEASEHRGDLTVRVARENAPAALRALRDDPACACDLLIDLCGVDWLGREPRYEVVYHLYSLRLKHRVRVKVGVPEDDPVLESATAIWKGADWFERECYDLMGILFRGHPFLRRILTHDDFQGHALRKDYDQHRRWRCTAVSNLESVVEIPPPADRA